MQSLPFLGENLAQEERNRVTARLDETKAWAVGFGPPGPEHLHSVALNEERG